MVSLHEPDQAQRDPQDMLRTYAIVVYVLYLVTGVTAIPTHVIGVILAYVKQADAQGTPYASHFDNAITIFWVTLVAAVAAWLPPLAVFLASWTMPLLTIFLVPAFALTGLGYLALFIWILVRTITGLVRAVDGRPYG